MKVYIKLIVCLKMQVSIIKAVKSIYMISYLMSEMQS